MRPVRLPRLRCALLGLLPLAARDGGLQANKRLAVTGRERVEGRLLQTRRER